MIILSAIFPIVVLLVLLLYTANKFNHFLVHIPIIYLIIACCEFLKRFIYVDGPTNSILYFIIVLGTDFGISIILLKNINIKKLTKRFVFWALAILGIVAYSTIHGNLVNSIITFRAVYYIVFLLMFKKEYYIPTPEMEKIHYTLFYILTAISVLYGMVQYFNGYLPWEVNWGDYSPSKMKLSEMGNFGKANRAFSLFSGSQVHALLLGYLFLSSWFIIKDRYRIFRWMLIGFYAFGIFIAGSKALMGGLILSLLFYYNRHLLKYKQQFLILIFLPLLSYFVITPSFLYMVQQFLRSYTPAFISGMLDPMTFTPRIMVFFNFFSSLTYDYTLIVGHGCSVLSANSSFTTDNMYLSILWEYGILGLILFVWFLYSFLKLLYILLNVDNGYSRKIIPLQIVFFTINVLNFITAQSLMSNGMLILFLLNIGYVYGIKWKLEAELNTVMDKL